MISHDPVTTERLILKKIMQVVFSTVPCTKNTPELCKAGSVLIVVLLLLFSAQVMSDSLQPHGLSVEFSRQEYWSGLPFPSPGDFPDPGMEPWSPALRADSLPSVLQGKPSIIIKLNLTFPSPPRARMTPKMVSLDFIQAQLITASHWSILN